MQKSPHNETNTDSTGRSYRAIKCKCGNIIGWEFIFRGRLRLRCANCGTIMIMVFRQRKRPKNQDKLLTNKERE